MQHAWLAEANVGLPRAGDETSRCDDNASVSPLCISANKQCDVVLSGCVITVKSLPDTYLII